MEWSEDSDAYRFALQVVRTLQNKGFIAYFAGGCVRDALMGNPAHDHDVATDARVEQVIELFGPKNTLAIGAAFGVACVHKKINGQRYNVEVATFRSDGTYSDGRRPDWVNYSSPEEDAKRRDFTINGMFYDPIANEVKDFVGGRQDLELRQIRAIGVPEDRIREDKLRMLRAVRFGARFGFGIDTDTWNAIEAHAPEITQVSGERIAAEMTKLLETSNKVSGVEKLADSGLLENIWPELNQQWCSSPQVKQASLSLLGALPEKSSFSASLAALSIASFLESLLPTLSGAPSPSGSSSASSSGGGVGSIRETALVEVLAEYSKHSRRIVAWAKELQSRWKFSNADTDSMAFALRNAPAICVAHMLPWSAVQPLLIEAGSEAAIDLADACQRAFRLAEDGVKLARQSIGLPADLLNPAPWVTGDDLRRMGLRPSPDYARILKEARRGQLDGDWSCQAEALGWVKGVAIQSTRQP